ncbi:hypothetical protein AC578_1588 [Pseudocercospora eumusae]|uniref:Protein kinase domain-containing protein n=1 Tax=Pseudocercospora eumusae TaxID=321146 RepID=A0A139HLW0_9PEZI|nr:hypothetical protein AC578_1588 [Pseudocercospora eumusae]
MVIDYTAAEEVVVVSSTGKWQPEGVKSYLAASSQNYVGLLDDGQTVLKYPLRRTLESMQTLYDEAERYARVGPHENLVAFKGLDKNGLLLEYCERGGLHNVVEEPTVLTDGQKNGIGRHIVSSLIHLHEHHFIHCDFHLRNIFLTSGMVAKIGDL